MRVDPAVTSTGLEAADVSAEQGRAAGPNDADPARGRTTRGRLRRYGGRSLAVVIASSCVGLAAFWWLRPQLVPTVAVERREVVQTVVASGRVLPAARVRLAALGLGRIAEVTVREGDRVTRGALLARQEDEGAREDLARARAIVLQARIRLAAARGPTVASARQVLARADTTLADERSDLARLERSAAGGGVTGRELEHARAQVELRRSDVESARIAVRSSVGVEARGAASDLARAEVDVLAAQIALANLSVLSPTDGLIVLRAVEVGDVATAGQVLFELAVDGPVEVRIDPDESTLASLAPGQPALLSIDAFPDRPFEGHVATVASAVDPQRGTIEVRLSVTAPPPELRADMTVSVDVEVARRPGVLVVPAGCVRGVGTDSPWVMLAVDGRAVRRDVQLGAVGDGATEVRAGVAEGDRAISMESSTVAVGARVRDGGESDGAS